MDYLAKCIVNESRMHHIDTGTVFQCNGVNISKVKVTGGIGVKVYKAADEMTCLLFPMAEVESAVVSFMVTARSAGVGDEVWEARVFHANNNMQLLHLRWNENRKELMERLVHLLRHPPLAFPNGQDC